jgi:hypothetical protein
MLAFAGKKTWHKGRARRATGVRRRIPSLTAFRKERLQDSGAIGGEDAGGDLHLMVEARVGEDFEAGADRAAFGIVGAENEARDTGLDDGARAHVAGLDGDVEGGVREAVVAEEAGGFAKDDHFGVGRGIDIADGAISGTSEEFALVDEHRTDGDFSSCGRAARFSECLLHEPDVSFRHPRENNTREEGKRIQTRRHGACRKE